MNLRYWNIAALLLCVGSVCSAEDWPQWRGPERNGVWSETNVITTLPEKPEVMWRADIGSGYSGPTVANGKVYLMDRITEPEASERVLCIDANSGKQIWKHEYECQYSISYTAGPRASVTIHDGHAYAFGAMGNLFCFEADTGKIVWEKDLNAEYKIVSGDRTTNRMPIWGMTCSPIIYKDKVILQVGAVESGVIAFNRKTGEEVWTATDDRGQYSSPVLTKQGDQDVLVCWTGDSVNGLDPNDGTVLWYVPWKPSRTPLGCGSPVLKDNHVFCSSFYDGSMLIELGTESPTAKKVWHLVGVNERQTKALHSMISTPLWIDDHIYGVDSYGEFRCLVAETGERVWVDETAVPKSRWSNIHFVQNGDTVWMFNERGELISAKLSPEKFEELSRAKIIEPTKRQLNRRGGVCWSHPAFAMRSVFVRNDNELIRVNLADSEAK